MFVIMDGVENIVKVISMNAPLVHNDANKVFVKIPLGLIRVCVIMVGKDPCALTTLMSVHNTLIFVTMVFATTRSVTIHVRAMLDGMGGIAWLI